MKRLGPGRRRLMERGHSGAWNGAGTWTGPGAGGEIENTDPGGATDWGRWPLVEGPLRPCKIYYSLNLSMSEISFLKVACPWPTNMPTIEIIFIGTQWPSGGCIYTSYAVYGQIFLHILSFQT